MVVIQLYSFYARYTEGPPATAPKGLILSLVAVCILLFTGWKGGELVYRYPSSIRRSMRRMRGRRGWPPDQFQMVLAA
jgi:uncharacterized membrane protein